MKRVLILLAITAALGACQIPAEPARQHALTTPNLISRAELPRDLLSINSVAILPPDVDPRADAVRRARYSLVEDLYAAAQEQLDLTIAPADQMQKVLGPAFGAARHESAAALSAGKKLGSDAVLSTKILKFVNREGSAVGASTPAAVDFSMSLLRVSDGKEVWSASYHFQDASLTENLFKVEERFNNGRGPGWRSAADLLSNGFRSALKDFSSQRFAQFSSSR